MSLNSILFYYFKFQQLINNVNIKYYLQHNSLNYFFIFLFKNGLALMWLRVIRHGNGAGWGWVLHSPSPYPIIIYLPVTLPIPNEDEKMNLIPIGFGYPCHIPTFNIFFLIKIEVFLQPLEKYCNALSNNMLTLTFVRPIDLIARLNINGSFYNMTIIKQITTHINIKIIFCIWDGFGYGFGVDTYIPVTRPTPVFWNRGKPKPIPKPNQNEKNPSN